MQDKTIQATTQAASNKQSQNVSADLIAVVTAVTNGEPRVLTIGHADAFTWDLLPHVGQHGDRM